MAGNTSATGGFILDFPPPVPPSAETIERALQTMTVALSGIPGPLVRPRWQPTPPVQPPPEITWASVGVSRVEMDDYPSIVHDGATTWPGMPAPGVDRMQRHGTVTVMATFYGPAAEDAAGQMRDALYVPQNWEPMSPLQMKLRTVRDLARVPELVNQQWLNRIDLVLEFRVQLDRVYPIMNLNGADVNLRTDNGMPDTPVSVRPKP